MFSNLNGTAGTRRGHWTSAMLLGLLVVALSCCADAQDASLSTGPRSKPTVGSPGTEGWPAGASSKRIEYLYTFSHPRDLGWKKSIWRKVLDWVEDGGDRSVLVRPYALAVDSAGRIIATDLGSSDILIFDFAKKSVKRISGPKGKQFGVPVGLAVDRNQNIYVSDAAAGRVVKFSRDGKFLAFIGGEEGAFKRPAGIAYSAASDWIYVIDSLRPRVFVYTPAGELVKQFGAAGEGAGQFNLPTTIVADDRGDVYVNDTMNFRVQVFDADGKFVRLFGRAGDGSGDFSRSKGIAIDSDRHLYIADALFSTVQIFDAQGGYLLNFGDFGTAGAQFYIPAGIAVDAQNHIYVADPFQSRIEVFRYLPDKDQTPSTTVPPVTPKSKLAGTGEAPVLPSQTTARAGQ